RPTWHFVAPADIRWLLKLTAARVHARCAIYYRKMELDARVFSRSHKVFERALQGGRHLTRAALASALQKAGIEGSRSSPIRVSFLMMRAELDAVICSGPRTGKQFTYALLEERVPPARTLTRAESLAELVVRYFTSHGPATVKDFVWWSGLTSADARAGLDAVHSSLASETINGTTYWGPRTRGRLGRVSQQAAYLLPAYDEALLSYRDNREEFAPYGAQSTLDNGHVIVFDGRAVGTWRRTLTRNAVVIEVAPFTTLNRRETRAVAEVAARYGRFMNLDASVVYRSRRT
ncbi:MAG: winged helix DNA-binding domain-containing protein, partial [Vicinamibacterales bacterium]